MHSDQIILIIESMASLNPSYKPYIIKTVGNRVKIRAGLYYDHELFRDAILFWSLCIKHHVYVHHEV